MQLKCGPGLLRRTPLPPPCRCLELYLIVPEVPESSNGIAPGREVRSLPLQGTSFSPHSRERTRSFHPLTALAPGASTCTALPHPHQWQPA